MKTRLASLIIRVMQIKTTVKHHLTPGRIAFIKMMKNTCRQEQNSYMVLLGIDISIVVLESNMETYSRN